MSVVWWFERSDVSLTEPVSDVTVAGAAMVLATTVEAMDTSAGMEVDKIVDRSVRCWSARVWTRFTSWRCFLDVLREFASLLGLVSGGAFGCTEWKELVGRDRAAEFFVPLFVLNLAVVCTVLPVAEPMPTDQPCSKRLRTKAPHA